MMKFLFVCCLILVLVFAVHSCSKSSTTKTANVVAPAAEVDPDADAREYPGKLVNLTHYSWKKAGFGNVMKMNITVQNLNKFDVKDIEIGCGLRASSGTLIGTVTNTIYQVVPQNAKRTFRSINMGFIDSQSRSAECMITGLAVK
jgi:hypothetical protein